MDIKVKLSRDENLDYFNKEEIIIDIEKYLRGVVGAEIGNSSIEACKAQAVASRTFALRKYISQGFITDKSSKDQAYRISRDSSNYQNALLAIEETKGQVLYYNGYLINNAYFSSSNGGRVKSSQERWGGVRPYLISKDDPYDTGSGGGHGVGMSQNGAKHMAAQGFTYKDILAFYYPGTEIKEGYGMAKTKAQQVVEYCESRIGCGYIYGTSGQVCTQALIDQQKAQYSSIDTSVVRKWLGKRVYDCAGFTRMAMQNVGIKIVSGATSQWNKTKWAEKGTINTLPKDKVCLLYRWTGSVMQHTGVYCGNGYFIDARGSATGVIKSKLGSYAWTHWGIPEGLYNETEEETTPIIEVIKVAYQAKVIASSGSTVNMRAEASTSSNKVAAVAVGQIVNVTEEVNSDWAKVTWNNKTGYMMRKYLSKIETTVNEPSQEEAYYVRIKCSNKVEAERVAEILRTANVVQ